MPNCCVLEKIIPSHRPTPLESQPLHLLTVVRPLQLTSRGPRFRSGLMLLVCSPFRRASMAAYGRHRSRTRFWSGGIARGYGIDAPGPRWEVPWAVDSVMSYRVFWGGVLPKEGLRRFPGGFPWATSSPDSLSLQLLLARSGSPVSVGIRSSGLALHTRAFTGSAASWRSRSRSA